MSSANYYYYWVYFPAAAYKYKSFVKSLSLTNNSELGTIVRNYQHDDAFMICGWTGKGSGYIRLYSHIVEAKKA